MRFQSLLQRDTTGRLVPSKKALAYQVFYLENALAISKIMASSGLDSGSAYDIVGLPCKAVLHVWKVDGIIHVAVTNAGQFRDSIMRGMIFVLADFWNVSPDCVECVITGRESMRFCLYSQMSLFFDGDPNV